MGLPQVSETRDFISNNGMHLHGRVWPVTDASVNVPKALVYISHGFSEHMGFYETLGAALAEVGILAFGHDHYGHGKSEGRRAFVESIDHYVDDIIEHCQFFQQGYHNVPLYLVGHSMGGMVALRAALRYGEFFQGIVFQGPLIIPGPDVYHWDLRLTPWKALVANTVLTLLDWWDPELILGSVLLHTITRDDEMLQMIVEDNLRWKRGCKVRLLLAFVSCLRDNLSMLPGLRTPFLTMHGTGDTLCNVSGSRYLYEMAQSEDKELVEYPHAKHQLYLELPEVRQKSIAKTVHWILSRAENEASADRAN